MTQHQPTFKAPRGVANLLGIAKAVIKAAFFGGLFGGLLWGAAAQAGTITGSKHDFTAQAWSGGRICVACHTPHKSDTTVTDAPLWNHKLSTATYTLYSSPTMTASITQPGGNSKLCLSCHDGTVAVNSFGGTTGTTMISAANNLGTNLKASHPIGFTYDTALATADGSLFDPAAKSVTIGSGTQTRTGTISSMLLYGGKMECDSCHDVHNTFTVGAAGSGLVKVDPSGSKICLACHNK
jgi:predicted CXXCH cytochrome family protein